jgi:hypothetical protein
MLSPYKQGGLLHYIDPRHREFVTDAVRDDIQIAFDDLYEAIEGTRGRTLALAKQLRFVFFGVDDPDKDDWRTCVFL